MKTILLLLSLFSLFGLFLMFNYDFVFAQESLYFESSQDETRATTLYFSIQPLDNWAYQNVDYNPPNFFGFTTNNAVEMFSNEFDNMSMVYGVIAQDGYYTLKNAKLNHYVKYKMDNLISRILMVQNYYLNKMLLI